MAKVTEWIEYECYGEIWQPGFVAWKDGRIEGSPLPLNQWDAGDVAFALANLGDFSSVTDWRAVYVREETTGEESIEMDKLRIFSVSTTTIKHSERTVKDWNDQDKADDVWYECFGEEVDA